MAYVRRKTISRHLATLLLLTSILLLILANGQHKLWRYILRQDERRTLCADILDIRSQRELETLRQCPLLPGDLGLVGEIPVNITAPTWQELESLFPDVERGGLWRPKNCVSRSRVAIVVPYRNRDYNLRAFLRHLHPFLQKQQLHYGIFVVEQAGTTTFNRGIVRNIGFQEANLHNQYDCTTFHDVDLLPENDMNYYGCPDVPRHMCIAIDYFNYKPIASGAVFGGIVSFRNDHFRLVNGYSNLYFGWGGEDDDLMTRCRKTGVGFYRTRPQFGRYKGTAHDKDHRIRSTYQLWSLRKERADRDGLNSLQYNVIRRKKRTLYTWILVDVNEDKYQREARHYLSKLERNRTNRKTTAIG